MSRKTVTLTAIAGLAFATTMFPSGHTAAALAQAAQEQLTAPVPVDAPELVPETIEYVAREVVQPLPATTADVPVLTEEALRQMQGPAVVEAQIINGAPLSYNWDHSTEAEGTDARARMIKAPIDVLILTEAQPIADQITGSDTAANIARFADLAAKTNPDARVFLYETWPILGDDVAAWQAAIAAESE